MKLSVILPVRNCGRTIAAAVRSVVQQSFRDWELIVIDDGSDDTTCGQLSEVRDKRIKTICDGRWKGLPERLNEGIDAALGDYIARMDGDDICFPHRFERQLSYLQAHPDIDLVGGGLLVFGDRGQVHGRRIPPEGHEDISRRPSNGFPMADPTFMGRAAWFKRWKYSTARRRGACDQDLLLRSFCESRFANLPEIVLGYREHRIVLRKCLGYRKEYAYSLINNRRILGTASLTFGLSLIAIKSVIDVVAVGTGLQHQLLRHRARPAEVAELARWRELWLQLQTNP